MSKIIKKNWVIRFFNWIIYLSLVSVIEKKNSIKTLRNKG
jgi:hypothetical protein